MLDFCGIGTCVIWENFTFDTLLCVKAATRRCFSKKILQNSQKNTCDGVILNNVAGLQTRNHIKK